MRSTIPAGRPEPVAFEMGNAYQINGAKSRNGTLLHQMYFLPLENDWPMHRVRAGGFEDTQEQLAALGARLDPSLMRRDDAALVVEELRCGAELASAGAAIGAAKYARANGGTRGEGERGLPARGQAHRSGDPGVRARVAGA